MGGMVACKLASTAPGRCLSLTLLSCTQGGSDIIPRSWQGLKNLMKGLMARSPEDKVNNQVGVDLYNI